MTDRSGDQKVNQVQKHTVMIRMLFQKTLDSFLRHISTQRNLSPKMGKSMLIKLEAIFNEHEENLVPSIN